MFASVAIIVISQCVFDAFTLIRVSVGSCWSLDCDVLIRCLLIYSVSLGENRTIKGVLTKGLHLKQL